MTKTTSASAPAATNASYLESDTPAKLRRARRMARQPGSSRAVSDPPAEVPAAHPARAPSKIAQVLALLRRSEGATLAELVEATGWLPHTTRAALTGLRKKGDVLTKDKRGEATCYRIMEAE